MTVAAAQQPAAIGYVPQHRQAIAHSCPAEDVFFGGSLGGGKSEFLVNDAIFHCVEHPKASAIILRREHKELERLINRSKEWLGPWTRFATWQAGKKTWEFNHGSRLIFGNAEHENDIEKYTGDEYSFIGMDEGPTFTPYQLQYIRSRNRSSVGIAPVFRTTGNPHGISFWDFRTKYVDPPNRDVELVAWFDEDACFRAGADPGGADYASFWRWYDPGTTGNPSELIAKGKGLVIVWRPRPTPALERRNKARRERGDPELQMPTICFIPSFIQDNQYLYADGEYERGVAAALGDRLADALLEGNWDRFEGQAFADFDPDRHVIDPISIPEAWSNRVWGGFDWGWRDPLAHLWLVTNPQTRQIIVYRELYEDHLHDSEACRLIQEKTQFPERLRGSLSDPMMWRGDSHDDALSKADIYKRNGVFLEKANNDRVPGWSRIHDLLALDPVTQQPRLLITRNCENLIRELQAAVVDETKPEDIDHDCSDHALDALRYACMAGRSERARYSRPVVAGRITRR